MQNRKVKKKVFWFHNLDIFVPNLAPPHLNPVTALAFKDVRSPLLASGPPPPQVRERSQPQLAGPRQVDASFQLQVVGPPKVRERFPSQPKVAAPPQGEDGSQMQVR